MSRRSWGVRAVARSLVVVAICLLQYAAISRALRPTRDILLGLDRLARHPEVVAVSLDPGGRASLGAGRRLFEAVRPLKLEQVKSRAASQVTHVTYRVLS